MTNVSAMNYDKFTQMLMINLCINVCVIERRSAPRQASFSKGTLAAGPVSEKKIAEPCDFLEYLNAFTNVLRIDYSRGSCVKRTKRFCNHGIYTASAGFVLSGCSSDDKNTITFWTPLTGEDGAYMDQLVKEYNATEPEIKLKHVITSDMYTKLSTVINSGKGIPDLAIIHADRVPGFVKQNVLEPMTAMLAAQPEIKEENYLPQAWSTGTIDGTQYTVPLDIHSNAMYYNKDLLKKYNAESFLDDDIVTIDEMLSLQGKLDEGDFVVNDALLGWVILGQLQNVGGDVQKDGKPALNTPEMKAAFESVKRSPMPVS